MLVDWLPTNPQSRYTVTVTIVYFCYAYKRVILTLTSDDKRYFFCSTVTSHGGYLCIPDDDVLEHNTFLNYYNQKHSFQHGAANKS